MMLDFYGMKLINKETGKLDRKDNDHKFERYTNAIIESGHNKLRITRILICLNCTGFRKYAIELIKFFESEM